MKSSCISWPEKEPLVLIRASQVRICEGNHCAAALLSYFEYWHNMRLYQREQAEHHNQVATMHGDEGTQDTSLLQYHTETGIEEGLVHLYGRSTIRKGLALLLAKGFLSFHDNPNPRYHFDRTRYFLFHPERVQRVIYALPHDVKVPDGEGENEKLDDVKIPDGDDANERLDDVKIPDEEKQGESPVLDDMEVTDRAGKSNAPSRKSNAPSRKSNAPIAEITSEITYRDPTHPTRACEYIHGEGAAPGHGTRPYQAPQDFMPTPAMVLLAQQDAPHVDLDLSTKHFKTLVLRKPVLDWQQRWYQYILEQEQKAQAVPGSARPYVQARTDREATVRATLKEAIRGRHTRPRSIPGCPDAVIEGADFHRVDG